MTRPPPSTISGELINGIESAPLDQALGEAEGQRGVIGPLTRLKMESPTADHVRDRNKGARPLEFERRTEGVAHGQTQQRPSVSVNEIHGTSYQLPAAALRFADAAAEGHQRVSGTILLPALG
jgi:hypothetical protein